MTTRTPLTLFALFSLGLILGCEVPELEGVDAPSAMPVPQATSTDTAEQEVEEKKGWEQTELVDTEPPVTAVPREVTANDPTKGKRSKQAGGYLGAVGHSRFYAEHKMIFSSIEHALNLYWAEHGNYPETHEEFMEKIVAFNQIKLPELDEGVEYIYDPADHKLKIYRPDAAAPADGEAAEDAEASENGETPDDTEATATEDTPDQ